MASINRCEQLKDSPRRTFWTTQPAACGEYSDCGEECGIPGLIYIDQDVYIPGNRGRIIATNDWLHSLLLNILNTKGRVTDPSCRVQVSAVNGHWSESYREDNLHTGTRIWAIAQQPVNKIQDAVSLLNATLQADLAKLIQMGVATSVEVQTEYEGKNKVSVTITVYGPMADKNVINLTSERLAQEWVWR